MIPIPTTPDLNTDSVQEVLETDRVIADFVNEYYARFLTNDKYLSAKIAEVNAVRYATFTVAGWTAKTGGGWTQTVSVTGMTNQMQPMVTVSTDGVTVANTEEYLRCYAMITRMTSGNGTVTAECNLEKPTMAVKVMMKGV